MSGLEILGVVAVVLLAQLAFILLTLIVLAIVVRKAVGVLVASFRKLWAAADDDDDDDTDEASVWDRALKDPAISDILRKPTVGNPRDRFVEPGKLDL